MTTDQIGTEHEVCGAPQPPPRRWGWRGTAAAVAVAAVIAALGGAAIYAATEGSSHSFGAQHQAFAPGGGMSGASGQHDGAQHGGIGGPGPAAVDATSLHGEFVVPDGAGGYTTVLTQTGTVTAISPRSITVRSVDGFSQAYVIPTTAGNAGTPPFALNDQVVIRATRNGQTATVTNIGDPQRGAPPGLDGPGGPPGLRPPN
jgi:hypothetical protein